MPPAQNPPNAPTAVPMIFAAVDDPAAAAVACAFRGDSSRHAGVSGLRGVVIGAPIGAVIGAVIGYQVAK